MLPSARWNLSGTRRGEQIRICISAKASRPPHSGLADPMASWAALGIAGLTLAPGHEPGDVGRAEAVYLWLFIFVRLNWLALEVCMVVSLLNLIGMF
jgi:hypothetical protein